MNIVRRGIRVTEGARPIDLSEVEESIAGPPEVSQEVLQRAIGGGDDPGEQAKRYGREAYKRRVEVESRLNPSTDDRRARIDAETAKTGGSFGRPRWSREHQRGGGR